MVFKRSKNEINMISKSCQIVADTLNMIEEYVVPGRLVSELDQIAEKFIRSCGARPAFKGYMGFPSTLCVSIEDAVVHGIPGDIELKEGQIVGIDCGAELNGYYGDHAKTFSVGKISNDKKRLMIESIQEPWNIAWAKYLVAKRRLKTVPNLRRQRLLGKKYR